MASRHFARKVLVATKPGISWELEMGKGRRGRVSKWGSPPCKESWQKTIGMGVI